MKVFGRLYRRAAAALIQCAERRPPDFVIGGHENPYLLRWWLIPRNPVFNIYLHKFLRDDDDRALHDHPWCWCSILLRGGYFEHRTKGRGAVHFAPSIRIASAWRAHRIQLFGIPGAARVPAWTLFLTGPRIRAWGFHCPKGWVHWRKFTAADDRGAIGPGCDA
jgi:hypothetical protein